MRQGAVVAATALAVGAVALWAERPPAPPSQLAGRPGAPPLSDGAGHPRSVEVPPDVREALRRVDAADPRRWPPPQSQRDTAVDGALAVDADGHLVVGPALLRFFDYFFIASGEESPPQIAARLRAAITTRVDGPAEARALELVDRYLQYRERGRELAEAPTGETDLAERVAAVHRLRREVFGDADADALFADLEALETIAAEQHRIATDGSLTAADRTAALAVLDAQLPDAVRQTRAAVTAPLRLHEQETALREAGASADEITELREREVGREAAARLAALDAQRAQWQQRVDAYRDARAAITADASLDAAARERTIEALRNRSFSGPELLRVRALERIEHDAGG